MQPDITDCSRAAGTQTIVVRAEDDPHDLAKPRGKQDWQLEPHAIWYPRTTGIWQTVWLERVPRRAYRLAPLDAQRASAGRSRLERRIGEPRRATLRLQRAR